MKLPDGTGLQLIEHLQARPDAPPVAVITAFGSVDLAIESMKAGAFDFLTKPIDLERLRGLIANALNVQPGGEALRCPSELQLIGEAPPVETRHSDAPASQVAAVIGVS